MAQPQPQSGIMEISPYIGGEAKAEGAQRLIRLASNENALGTSPKAAEAYRNTATELHRYPDGSVFALREALGKAYNLPMDQIVCGAGSDELISLLISAYAGEGDEVLYSQHGFLMYAISAKAVGAKPVTAKEIDLKASVDDILAAVTERTKLVFLANPNNPTGSYLNREELTRLREGLREDIILALDGAYAEFVTVNDYTAGADLVEQYNNVVMLRTFSKAYGLAALRLGWCYAPTAIADVLNRVRGPFNVCAPAIAAGVAAVEDTAFLKQSVEHNTKWREWLADELTAMGYKVHPSLGNFLLVDFDDAEAMRLYLKSKGALVRQMGAYGLPNSLRITIGTEQDMRELVGFIKESADV